MPKDSLNLDRLLDKLTDESDAQAVEKLIKEKLANLSPGEEAKVKKELLNRALNSNK
ncbi:hypothetical protein K8R42_02965 [bacterium]|nr:hypothetical protein [bacterium]